MASADELRGVRFTGTDQILDLFENRKQLLVFGVVMTFEAPVPGMDAIAGELEKWTKMYPVLTCVREKDAWVPDPNYHQARHVRYLPMEDGADLPDIERLVSAQMSRPFSVKKPRWRAFYMDNLVGGRSALVFLMDHRLTDPEGLLRMIVSATSASEDERNRKLNVGLSRKQSTSSLDLLRKAASSEQGRKRGMSFFDTSRRASPMRDARAAARTASSSASSSTSSPMPSPSISTTPPTPWRLPTSREDIASVAAAEDDEEDDDYDDDEDFEVNLPEESDDVSFSSMTPTTPTSTNSSTSGEPRPAGMRRSNSRVGPVVKWVGKYSKLLFGSRKILSHSGSLKKETVLNELIDLAELRATAKAANASVNDTILSCVAGAIRNIAEQKEPGITKRETDARVFMMLTTRDADDWELSNKLTSTVTVLPLDMADPIERLAEITKRQEELKATSEASVNNFISKNAARLPMTLLRPLFNKIKKNLHMVYNHLLLLSPDAEICIGGSPVKTLHFPFPQINQKGGLGVSVIAYNGCVALSLTSDLGEFQPSSLTFLNAFNREYSELKHRLNTRM